MVSLTSAEARFSDAEKTWRGLARRGISVRIFPGDPDLAGCLRITCPGNAKEFARLVDALKETEEE